MNRLSVFALLIVFGLCSCSGSGARPRGTDTGDDMAAANGDDDMGFGACATASFTATQAPAAMLAILDRSASMASSNKFSFAANAIVQSLDEDLFDTMYLGLYATPGGSEPGPACLGFPLPVDCLNAPSPQVGLTLAGTNKSTDASGVRHDIKAKIPTLLPDASDPDSTPMYEAMETAISDLDSWPHTGKRILFVVTDGSFSCASLSNPPRTGLMDGNGCADWEDPTGVISLLKAANTAPNTPIDTFIVGVPGADTYDPSGVNAPEYHMRLALSAMAYAGSPDNVPANCTGKSYTENGGDPAVSCHFDLTQGNFSAAAISNAISQVRGKVLGCTFDLPQPDGGMVDPDQVNVTLTSGGTSMPLYRRNDPTNMCTNDGCWDYDSNGKLILIGKACDEAQMSGTVNVQIVVGCATIIG